MSRRSAKADNYIQQLDEARCESNWDAVPELIRKVRKHAPERTCLTLAAETEHAIAKATQNASPSTRPSTAVSAQELGVSSQLPKLLSAIEEEKSSLEERFQAQVCVGWLHWVVGEYSLASVRLPGVNDQEYPQFRSLDDISGWTKICVLKSAYLKANCLVRGGQRIEALQAFNLSLPSASGIWTTMTSTKQQRYWTELYLTEYCMLHSRALEQNPTALEDPNSLACFRCWSKYWDVRGAGVAGGYGFRGTVPRRRIWFEYYDVISEILKQDLPFPPGYGPINDEASARSQLYSELKLVETKYEALLLSETQFPKAEEERQEVETFVDLVMDNWTILNGGGWAEHDLGSNGKEQLSRGVLDLLYRASTKTYHSTAILRHLYRVHLAVAEFDLAFRSLDSYLELVKKAKARVEKTGHPEPSLDDDATVMETVSSGIAALCRYGDKGAAEKARTLAAELERWLEEVGPSPGEGMSPLREDSEESAAQPLGLKTQALSWQTVGLAQAQWARVTFDASSRAEIQSKAVRCLQKSLSADFGRAADIRGIFALGVLLAEKRELTPAIELVKTALLAEKANTREQELHNGPYWRERSLIPLWHLLSLLLSARQDYILASRACEGAFEQFKDPSVLFGNRQLNGTYRSDHLNEAEALHEKHDDSANGVVDDMDDYEKETILEVKMTQLAIIELLEGPKVAVNASLELLSLFSRLFGVPQIKVTRTAPSTGVPKSSAGTLRGIKTSIFGSKSERARTKHGSTTVDVEKIPIPDVPSRPQTTQTVLQDAPPALTNQITGESVNSSDYHRPRKSASVSRRSESGRRASLRKRDSSGSRRRAVSSGGASRPPTVVDGESFFTPFGEIISADNDFFGSFATKRFGLARSSSNAESYTSNGSSTRPGTVDLTGISVDRLEAHPALLPVIKFSEDHDKWRRSAVLIKVWLMIAGFYRRANMLGDANGAVTEAMKLVQSLETIVAKDSTGSLSLKHAGWAQKKSVEELWGDVWSEKGYLSVARGEPYVARADFESALMHYPDHPSATVGLSNILLDIYSEAILPPLAVPGLSNSAIGTVASDSSNGSIVTAAAPSPKFSTRNELDRKPASPPTAPLGLVPTMAKKESAKLDEWKTVTTTQNDAQLPPPYKATSLPLVDRLAARDRAYGLLAGLTKSGRGWNYSEAWFALARAHEESGQADKAKEVLWWCVELEEAMGVRDWNSVAPGGYVL